MQKKVVGLMTDNKKPEWFDLIDGDAPSARVTKINKKLPAMAILITAGVIATGTFFASSSEPTAQAEVTSTPTAITSVDKSKPTNSAAPTAKTVATAKPSASATPTVTGSVKNPAQGGVALPTAGRGDNEGEDDHGRGEHGDGQREEHEDDD